MYILIFGAIKAGVVVVWGNSFLRGYISAEVSTGYVVD